MGPFAKTFEEARRRAGLSRAGAARGLGVSLSTLKLWEAGVAVPTAARQAAILDALDRDGGCPNGVWSRAAAAFLEHCRSYSGLSARQAAVRAGVSLSRWWRVETGAVFLHPSTVAAPAQAATPSALLVATSTHPDPRFVARALRACWRAL